MTVKTSVNGWRATGGSMSDDDGKNMAPPDFPEGIDYDCWTHVVRPSAREAFADPLDLAPAPTPGVPLTFRKPP